MSMEITPDRQTVQRNFIELLKNNGIKKSVEVDMNIICKYGGLNIDYR